MQIPFVGPTYPAESLNINTSRSVNLYPIVNQSDSKSPTSLVGTPGTKLWVDMSSLPGPTRGMHVFNNALFVVCGNKLYEVATDGTYQERGTLNTFTGFIRMQDNGTAVSGVGGNQILIVDGQNGYIHDISGPSFGVITDPDFPDNPTDVAYIDGYFVVISNTSMRFSVSDLYNGTIWNGLAVAAVLASPDPILAVASNYQQLWFFKSHTSEAWYNTGTPTSQGSPFSRLSGSVVNYGIHAPASLARGAGGLFYLANVRNNETGELVGVVKNIGYLPTVISPPAITRHIKRMTNPASAFGYCYSDGGRNFFVLTFPDDDSTFVYDDTSGLWHERSTYDVPNQFSIYKTGTSPYSIHKHISNCYAYFAGKHLVGSYASGKILEMSEDVYDDDGYPIVAFRTAPAISDTSGELRSIAYHKLQVDMETGVGPDNADGTAPVATLAWSDDNGRSWSNEYPCPLGKVGEYSARLVWRRLGISRSRVFRITISDPVKRIILGAYAEIS